MVFDAFDEDGSGGRMIVEALWMQNYSTLELIRSGSSLLMSLSSSCGYRALRPMKVLYQKHSIRGFGMRRCWKLFGHRARGAIAAPPVNHPQPYKARVVFALKL